MTVPANGRKIFAFFVGGTTSVDEAIDRALAIDKTPASLSNKMTNAEIDDVVNWVLKKAVAAAASPSSSSGCVAVRDSVATEQAATSSAAFLLPLLGYMFFRRRRR